MRREWIEVEVSGGAQMPVLRMVPDEPSASAVIVCMHAPGVDDFIEEIGCRLAEAGFAAFAPDLPQAVNAPQKRGVMDAG